MAPSMIKSTYTLDAESVRTLEGLARHWRVSKSEARRRAIRTAADGPYNQGGRRRGSLTDS